MVKRNVKNKITSKMNFFVDFKIPIIIGSVILIIFSLILNFIGSSYYLDDEIGLSPKCTDSDGGKINEVKGTTTLSSSRTDTCIDDKTLREYFCDQKKKVKRFLFFSKTTYKDIINTYTFPCQYSCVEGACIDKIQEEQINNNGEAEYAISSVTADDSSDSTTVISINVFDKQGFGSGGGKIKVYNPATGGGGFIPKEKDLVLIGGSNSAANFVIGGGDVCPGITFKIVLDDSLAGNDEIDYAKEYDTFTVSLLCKQGETKCSSVVITGEYPEYGKVEQNYC